jgi:antitoxin (DNA-binding transcriptional repressor) of toxin-antitoxin stability system
MSLRALHREPPAGESVLVTRDGQVIGTFVPVAAELENATQAVAAAPKVRAARQAKVDAVLRKVARRQP